MELPLTISAGKDFTKCSFCGEPRTADTVLITGPGVSICADCTVQANATLLKNAGFVESFTNQFTVLYRKIYKNLVFILILLSMAFAIIIAATIFGR
jgi:hypothetical protein